MLLKKPSETALGEAYRGGKCETQFTMLPGEGLPDSYPMSWILPEQAKDRVRILDFISLPAPLPALPARPFFCSMESGMQNFP